ncbi:MAG: tyrosine-type recombinase/integrase [bacterium]|nr:tyrosine-type recombinase/integrase [bacterium]
MHPRFSDFAEHLKARRLAPNTLTPYLSELKRLDKYLDAEGILLEDFTLQQATHYLVREGRSSHTARRTLTVVNQFLSWAGHPLAAELGAMRQPRAYTPAPDYLSDAEEAALRKTLKARTDLKCQARDRALFCLMLDTGIRVAEVARMTVGDVNLDEKMIRLVAKGDKKRTRFVPVETRDLLKRIVGSRPAEEPLFLTWKERAICDRHIRRLLNQWAELAGITRPVHPHLLRHTFATSLLRKTNNLRLVQVALDHESPKTTAIYSHVADEELRAAIESRRD